MKKFGKIDLQNEVVLSDNEMKQVLGGSGSSATGGSGAGGKDVKYDCICTIPRATESGTLPPADKWFIVTAPSAQEALTSAKTSCSDYDKVDCTKI